MSPSGKFSVLNPLEFLVQRLGLGRILRTRQLGDGGLQVAQQCRHRRAVVTVESRQLVEDVMAASQAPVCIAA